MCSLIFLCGVIWTVVIYAPTWDRWRIIIIWFFRPLRTHYIYWSRSRSYFTTDSQSVSMCWYRAPLWDLRPDIISCRNVAVWNLRSCIYDTPSLTLRTRNHTLLSHWDSPQPGGPGSRIYIPEEQGGPVIPPGTGFTSIENMARLK
jgi:hypothetical protein